MWIRISMLVVMALAVSLPAQAAEDYFPLWKGCTWQYTGPFSLQQEVIGPAVFHTYVGTKVIWDLGLASADIYFWEYPDGDVEVHGLDYGGGSETVYDPPRPLFDFPLTTGKTWSYSGTVLEYESGVLISETPATGSWEVLGTETVTVPAGTFDTIVVQEVFEEEGPVRRPISWPFQRLGASKAPMQPVIHRIAAGVGWVTIPDDFMLESYSVPVARSTDSWGAIKALYGGGR
jgi:hypothetical protein